MPKKPQQKQNDLALVACHWNSAGFVKPVENLHGFINNKKVLNIDKDLFVGVCLFPGQESVKLDLPESNIFEFHSESILWQKEALLNAIVAKLPAQYTKVALLDADVIVDEGWYEATSQALDTHQIIQPWFRSTVIGEDGKDVPGGMPSVGKAVSRGDLKRATNWENYHPGYAWAMQRDFFTKTGGIFPYGIVGLADGLLAISAMNHPVMNHPLVTLLSAESAIKFAVWRSYVKEWLKTPLGCINHTIKVLSHGAWEHRKYYERLELLNNFSPLDLAIVNGTLEWTDKARAEKWPMIKAIAEHFHTRLEDGPEPIAEEITPEPDPNWPPPPPIDNQEQV